MSNIIFINALSARMGGGKTYILNLLNNLPEFEHKIYVVCPDKSLIPDDPRVIYISTKIAARNILLRAFWEFFYLPVLLLKLNATVLFVPGGMDFTFFTFRKPKITMFRNMLPFDKAAISNLPTRRLRLKNYVLKFLMIRTMRSADHVIFISRYAKNIVEGQVSLKGSSLIYHGIESSFTPNDTVKVGYEYLLYVSRFEPYKNHLNLIKAYKELSVSIRMRYKLVIVGELMEPAYSICAKYIEAHGISDFVVIRGKVPYSELPKIYNGAALFVYPSSCENCPNILLEAIGCGAPIAASKCEPIPEFLNDAGAYFDENDYEDIFRCLNEVLLSPALMSSMKKESRILGAKYSWEKTAMETWACLAAQKDKKR